MSRTILLSFAAGLALVVSPLAMAQGPPGGMRGPGGPGGPEGFGGTGGPMGPPLLMFPAVQKELKLTASQKSQYQKLQTTIGKKMQSAFSRPRQGRFDPEKMRTQMEAINKEQEKGIAKILKENQAKRLSEIELQREGIFAVARAPIAKKLKLTSDQSTKVKTIVDEMRQAQFAAMPRPPQGFQDPGGGRAAGGFQGGPPGGGPPGQGNFQGGPPGGGPPGQGNFQGGPPGGVAPGQGNFQGGPPGFGPPGFNMEEFRARMEKMMKEQQQIRTTATEKINGALTSEQKAAFQEMQGNPFDLSSLRPAFGPGPNGQNRATTKQSTRTRSRPTRQRTRRNLDQGSGDDQPR
ncbi:MAG: hypothetical protein ACP5XB_11490 [Isosphaeraceae bacterium]